MVEQAPAAPRALRQLAREIAEGNAGRNASVAVSLGAGGKGEVCRARDTETEALRHCSRVRSGRGRAIRALRSWTHRGYLEDVDSPFIQMHNLSGPEDARRFVDSRADLGATSLKACTNITRGELEAAIQAAHARGLTVTGDLCSVTNPKAADVGIDNLEHGFFVNTQLDPDKRQDACSKEQGGPTLRARVSSQARKER